MEVLNIEDCKYIKQLPIEIESLPNLKQIIISSDSYENLRVSIPNKPYLLTWYEYSKVDKEWMWFKG